jgi:hypothetical protein
MHMGLVLLFWVYEEWVLVCVIRMFKSNIIRQGAML